MKFDADTIYNLLPAVHRIRDAEQDGMPLRALVEVLAEQGSIVEGNIRQLYDNWFIETCEEWVVPYIGDLIGARHLRSIGASSEFSQRARAANTIGYRRRKGTAAMLEQLARDTTSWSARAVEFFQFLGWTQNYNHVPPRQPCLPRPARHGPAGTARHRFRLDRPHGRCAPHLERPRPPQQPQRGRFHLAAPSVPGHRELRTHGAESRSRSTATLHLRPVRAQRPTLQPPAHRG